MYQASSIMRIVVPLSLAAMCVLAQPRLAAANNEDPTDVAAAIVDEKYSEHDSDVKRLFASRCSWCHQGYGMKQADGPRLAGITKSRDAVIEQISRGKSPMPGFRKQLKEWQIESLADYIKALPND